MNPPGAALLVYIAGLAAAVGLGLGWVLQQRAASQAPLSDMLRFRLLLRLCRMPLWRWGVVAMVVGQTMGAWALSIGPVALVEPLLSVNLLVALVVAARLTQRWPRPGEVLGALLMSSALGVFIAVGDPHAAPTGQPRMTNLALGVGAAVALIGCLVAVARRRYLRAESILLAAGAGVLYGLTDVCTRGTTVTANRHGVYAVLTTPWPYLVLSGGVFGVLLSESAFRAARLDYSLPPTALAQPMTGIALGVSVLGDQLALATGSLVVEVLCVAAMVGGVVLIGRSPALSEVAARDEDTASVSGRA